MNSNGFYAFIFGIIAYFCFSEIWIGTSEILNSSGVDTRPMWFIIGGSCILGAGILLGDTKK